jgi:hypothetical protein
MAAAVESVITPMAKMNLTANDKRPCRFFFKSDSKGCNQAENCPFSHDQSYYIQYYNLKNCPTVGCTQLCGNDSTRCKTCHDSMNAKHTATIPCKNYYGPDAYCKNGNKCQFSHDDEVYDTFYSLKKCPTAGCKNKCSGRQCRQCHERYLARKEEIAARPEQQCSSRGRDWACQNFTKFRLCSDCYATKKQYEIPSSK